MFKDCSEKTAHFCIINFSLLNHFVGEVISSLFSVFHLRLMLDILLQAKNQ